MRKVFKYEIPIGESFALDLPPKTEILSFQSQRAKLCIWALVDPHWTSSLRMERSQTRHFRVVGTGHEIEEEIIKYHGTAQQLDGDLIWHLFEVKNAKA
jgi:hypothetical protein